MKEVDLAWLAGLLEGEGCFYACQPKFQPSVKLTMTKDLDVLDRARVLMGAARVTGPYLDADPKHAPRYSVTINSRKAIELMIAIRPHMGTRRQAQIDAALLAHRGFQLRRHNKNRFVWEDEKIGVDNDYIEITLRNED